MIVQTVVRNTEKKTRALPLEVLETRETTINTELKWKQMLYEVNEI